jgi:hypothetical protein
MGLKRKILWVVHLEKAEATFKEHVEAAGIDTVCINTMTHRFPDLIADYHKIGKTVWGWRWPGVRPSDAYGWHYYAPDQARFVAMLVSKGLDGFIVDPESNDDLKPNDWNQVEVDDPNRPGKKVKVSDLAHDFWAVIRTAVAGKRFHLGLTSGWDFPSEHQKTKLPWAEFIGPCEAVYPQTYWRIQGQHGILQRWGGSPAIGISKCLPIWKKIAKDKAIIPMAGEIDHVSAAEIVEYGKSLKELGVAEGHFYADVPPQRETAGVSPEVLQAIRDL